MTTKDLKRTIAADKTPFWPSGRQSLHVEFKDADRKKHDRPVSGVCGTDPQEKLPFYSEIYTDQRQALITAIQNGAFSSVDITDTVNAATKTITFDPDDNVVVMPEPGPRLVTDPVSGLATYVVPAGVQVFKIKLL